MASEVEEQRAEEQSQSTLSDKDASVSKSREEESTPKRAQEFSQVDSYNRGIDVGSTVAVVSRAHRDDS